MDFCERTSGLDAARVLEAIDLKLKQVGWVQKAYKCDFDLLSKRLAVHLFDVENRTTNQTLSRR